MDGLDNESFVRVSRENVDNIAMEPSNGKSYFTARFLRSLMRAIAQDDVESLRNVMKDLDTSKIMKILSGKDIMMRIPSAVNGSVWLCDSLVTQLKVRLPLSTAVVYQSLDCFKELVNIGADLFARDIRGNNVLHLLIYSYRNHESNVPLHMYDFILSKLSTGEERRKLLYCESDDGLRPLDLAAKLCCPRLFRAFLYTEGVYRQILFQTGMVVTNRFILPSRDCEAEQRSASFLWQLVWMEDTAEGIATINDILSIPAIQKLNYVRLRGILWYLVLWALFRFLGGALYLAVDHEADEIYYNLACGTPGAAFDRNQTFSDYLLRNGLEQFESTWLRLVTVQMIYGVLFGIAILVTDMTDFIMRVREGTAMAAGLAKQVLRGRVENSSFYRICMIVLAIHYLASAILFFSQIPGGGGAMGVLALNGRVLISISILYFLQLAPLVGVFVIGFQKMLAAMGKFVGLQMGAMYLFSSLFRHVRTYFCKIGTSSCDANENLYATFLAMLNMVEVVPSKGTCDDTGEALLKVLHVLYVFIVAVLTINYLIAIMSSVYSYFSDQVCSVVAIHRVNTILVIERRLRILSSIFSVFKKEKDMATERTEVVIEVEEIDSEQECLKNLRLGDGPFGDYCSFGTNVDQVKIV